MNILENLGQYQVRQAVEVKALFEDLFRDKKRESEWLNMPFSSFIEACRIVNPQLTSGKVEKALCKKYGWKHSANNKTPGDAVDADGKSLEIKHSFITTSNNQLNIKQARVDWDNSDYRVFAFCGNLMCRFDLTHSEIMEEILISGANNTHKNGSDYSFSIPWNEKNKNYIRWQNKYCKYKGLII